jgi:hypothetical protein
VLHNRFFRFLLIVGLALMAALTVRQAVATAEVVSGGLSLASGFNSPLDVCHDLALKDFCDR